MGSETKQKHRKRLTSSQFSYNLSVGHTHTQTLNPTPINGAFCAMFYENYPLCSGVEKTRSYLSKTSNINSLIIFWPYFSLHDYVAIIINASLCLRVEEDFCHKPHIFAPYYYCCKWQHARPSDFLQYQPLSFWYCYWYWRQISNFADVRVIHTHLWLHLFSYL